MQNDSMGLTLAELQNVGEEFGNARFLCQADSFLAV